MNEGDSTKGDAHGVVARNAADVKGAPPG